MSNNQLEYYIDQLNFIYSDEPWFGDSYMDKLSDVTEEIAFTRPLPEIHSIAELISHVIYWRLPLIKRLRGERDYKGSMDSEDNWKSLARLKKAGWKKLLAEFDDSQKQLLKLLKSADPSFLDEEYSPGRTWRKYVMEGMIQHDVYHLGQLALVKKMVMG